MARPFHFRVFAGSLQLQLDSFESLVGAMELPEALWVATACPVESLHCDSRFLKFLDADQNGRVRVEEVKAAVKWLQQSLVDYQGVDEGSERLVLSRLAPSLTTIRKTAEMLLASESVADRSGISLEQVRRCEAALAGSFVNGDGIVAPEAIADAKVRAFAESLLSCLPGPSNRSGKMGVDRPLLQQFLRRRFEALAHRNAREGVFVWGDESLGRARRVRALTPRIQEYFLQCRLVATQPESAQRLRLPGDRVEATLGDVSALSRSVGALPIAPPNPAIELQWENLFPSPDRDALLVLRQELGQEPLTEAAWRTIVGMAERILQWQEVYERDPVCRLPALEEPVDTQVAAIEALCDADLEHRDSLAAIDTLEKLLLFQKWLLCFANSFVAMPDLYDPTKKALFERGRLVLAGREFRLAVRVSDPLAHAKMAEHASMCLIYVKVESTDGGYEVAIPVTAGTSNGIEIGKRGIFYDLAGKEYDAVITGVVSQPVSLWEAMTLPLRRLGSFAQARIEEFAAAGDKMFAETMSGTWGRATSNEATTVQHGGLLAAGGVAFAAVSSSAAFVVTELKNLTLMELVQGSVALVLIVMVPSGLLAWLKLRRRNLAVVLEGAGWAINDRLLLTEDLGRLFTRRPALPKDATVDAIDAVKKTVSLSRLRREDEEIIESRGGTLILLILALAMVLGVVSYWETIRSTVWGPTVIPVTAPATETPPSETPPAGGTPAAP